MTDALTHYIGGEAVAADAAGSSLKPSNPDDIVARYPRGGAAEVDAAAKAARAAFPAWSEASPEVRSDLLDKVGSTIMARAKELGALLSREEGKTVAVGTGEVLRAARIFKYFTGAQGVGARVAEAAIKRQARVQLEMGGKNPLVVLDDADLDRAGHRALQI